jgi:endonuclease/exonuclease/phosphatase family metal-dependent hydrolase
LLHVCNVHLDNQLEQRPIQQMEELLEYAGAEELEGEDRQLISV